MAALVKFFAGKNGGASFVEFASLAVGSGLGFYGASFGSSVQVGQYPDKTYIASSDGTLQGPEANNTKKMTTTSGVSLNGTTEKGLRHLGNQDAAVNIRFTYDSAVKTQAAQLRVFDRTNKDNDPSGVTTQVGELVNPWPVAESPSGSATWVHVHGSGVVMDLVSSPGTSGLRPDGADTTDTRHDWYVALSATPTEVGSKTAFGLYFELQYL